jgi:hypothetical protein
MKRKLSFFYFILFLSSFALLGKQINHGFVKSGDDFIFSNLKMGDSRKDVLSKMRESGYLQIYEERNNQLVKCALKINGFRYELAAKLDEDELNFCLIEGQKGWQFSFYEDVVEPQWENLRKVLIDIYGKDRKHRDFPELFDVPLNDKGGHVTDTWDLDDRVIILTVLLFEVEDCCTNQMVEYSCCTLLIKPKV